MDRLLHFDYFDLLLQWRTGYFCVPAILITFNFFMLSTQNNQLTDISPLKELENLKWLNLENNPLIIEQVNGLKKALPGTNIGF